MNQNLITRTDIEKALSRERATEARLRKAGRLDDAIARGTVAAPGWSLNRRARRAMAKFRREDAAIAKHRDVRKILVSGRHAYHHATGSMRIHRGIPIGRSYARTAAEVFNFGRTT